MQWGNASVGMRKTSDHFNLLKSREFSNWGNSPANFYQCRRSSHISRAQRSSFWTERQNQPCGSCLVDQWSITQYHTDATNTSNWWMPIEPSLCLETLHPMYGHQVKYNYPSNWFHLPHPILPASLLQDQDSAWNQSSPATAFCALNVQNTSQILPALSFKWLSKTSNLHGPSFRIF